MAWDRARIRHGCLLVLGLLLAGCLSAEATRYAYFLAEDARGQDVHRWLVAPFNFEHPPPQHVIDAGEVARSALIEYLRSRDGSVETLSLRETLDELAPALREAGWTTDQESLRADRFDAVLAQLSRRLARKHSFEVLVIPWLSQRAAAVSGTDAYWDGVHREVRTYRLPRSCNWISRSSMHGGLGALSIHLILLAPDGRKLFEDYAGLELLHEVAIACLHVELPIRSDLLGDRGILEESVRESLSPFLPPPPEDAAR